MKLIVQRCGMKDCIPYGAPHELENRYLAVTDTERRKRLLQYLEEHKVDVSTDSYIRVKLRQDMEMFQKTKVMDFHIYHHDGLYGFYYLNETKSSYCINVAYYKVVDVDTSRPWMICNPINDVSDWVEGVEYIVFDEDNRMMGGR